MKLPPAVIVTQGAHHVTATTKLTQHCCTWTGHEIIVATCSCGWQTRATTRHQITQEANNHVRRTA